MILCVIVFFFKQKTAYEMRISDWSSDVCSSDLRLLPVNSGLVDGKQALLAKLAAADVNDTGIEINVVGIEAQRLIDPRSEERRVGKECVNTCRSRWSPYH